MIRIAGSVSKSWLAQRLGVAFNRDYYFDTRTRHEVDTRCNAYEADKLSDLNVFYTESNLGRRQWHAPNQVLVGGIQPNMIVGMLLGADFRPAVDADADISERCLAGTDLDALPPPDDFLAHPLVQQWQRDIEVIFRSSGNTLRPIPPFFWDGSGRAAVHGAVTSGLKFLGDDFFMDLLSCPDSSRKIVTWLAEISSTLVSHFSDIGRLPVTGIHVGECVSCMLDVATFRRYVVPATSLLGERFGALRFHSCGCSDHIIESCREITGLAELDVGGSTSVDKIRRVFGPDFPVGIAPLVEDLRAASESGILSWHERVARENQGGNLTIGFHLESGYRLENLRALHAAVAAMETGQSTLS